jgi:hypothetical protein
MRSFALFTPWIAGTAMAAGALLFACSDDPSSLGAGGAGTGVGGTTTDDVAATTAPASQAVVTTTTGATSTSSGMFMNCDPPPDAGTFYDNTDVGVFPPNDTLSMCPHEGEVLLIFNAAAI